MLFEVGVTGLQSSAIFLTVSCINDINCLKSVARLYRVRWSNSLCVLLDYLYQFFLIADLIKIYTPV